MPDSGEIDVRNAVLYLPFAIAYCGVDGFALISGYVGVNSRFRLSKIIKQWLQVAFYSIVITVILFFALGENQVTVWDIFRSFLPVITNRYWYFTAYFALFFIMPLLNNALNTIPQKEMSYLLIGIVLVFSVLSWLAPNDIWYLNKGQNVWWLAVLYLVGGYCRKYEPLSGLTMKKILGLLAGAIVLTWMATIGVKMLSTKIEGLYLSILRNNSPFVLLMSVWFLLLFSRIKVNNKSVQKAICICSPLTFGVYLIHVHPQIFTILLQDAFISLASFPLLQCLMAVFFLSLLIMGSCLLIDYGRKRLFDRVFDAVDRHFPALKK